MKTILKTSFVLFLIWSIFTIDNSTDNQVIMNAVIMGTLCLLILKYERIYQWLNENAL